VTDFAHLLWFATACVALALGVGLFASAGWRSWVARTRVFRIAFGDDRPDRARWLAGFYLFAAVWGFTLFFAVASS
jgi:hypothetical protein